REGQRRGEISAEYDPHELADIFIATYYAVIIRWLHGDGGRSLTERLHSGAAIFLAGVAPSRLAVAARRPLARRAGSHSLRHSQFRRVPRSRGSLALAGARATRGGPSP